MIRILVAEDTDVVRETVVALVTLEDDIEVVAAVVSGNEIVPAALAHHPDVALLDVRLPGTDGITAATELRSQLPSCRILMLTGLDKPETLAAALDAGIAGYLLKGGPARELIDAIRAVARGEQVIDARMERPAPDGRERHSPR